MRSLVSSSILRSFVEPEGGLSADSFGFGVCSIVPSWCSVRSRSIGETLDGCTSVKGARPFILCLIPLPVLSTC